MELEHWLLLVAIAILAGLSVLFFIVLLPLIRDIEQTVQQFRITVTTLDSLLNNEVKSLLTSANVLLEEIERTNSLVRHKLSRIPIDPLHTALAGITSKLALAIALWAFRKITGRRGKG